MIKNKTLVIVESPAKATCIQKILGQEQFIVKSSMGHIRDLDDAAKHYGVDVDNDFKPTFTILQSKKKIVYELKEALKSSSDVLLASDEDREGEGIAWNLAEVLGLKNRRRMVFHEITKPAILEALNKTRPIDMNLVHAQHARQVLDKLIGYDISRCVSKHVSTGSSAGRVQSVALRFVVEHERKILEFKSTLSYNVKGLFEDNICGRLNVAFSVKEDVIAFLAICMKSKYIIGDQTKKRALRYPQSPFMTSSLQKDGGKKLNMSSKDIMSCAQSLYENGYITYHRTDAVNLAESALSQISEYITTNYGAKYLNVRQYKSKDKNSQEAHEAIRPTDINRKTIGEDDGITAKAKKLYELIWKRTIASQMSPAEVDLYSLHINIIDVNGVQLDKFFISNAEVIIFDGYLVIYDYNDSKEDDEEEVMSKPITKKEKGQIIRYNEINAIATNTQPPKRYDEPDLITQMKNNGIGRPSTYASIISIIQERKFVEKRSIQAMNTENDVFTIKPELPEITESKKSVQIGAEKNRLFPTELGIKVVDFLISNFDIFEYNITSQIEESLDLIANGKKSFSDVVASVYIRFEPIVSEFKKQQSPKHRLICNDPQTNEPIYALLSKNGPVLQVGMIGDKNIKFIKMPDGYTTETITDTVVYSLLKSKLEDDAIGSIGLYDDKPIHIKTGKFGRYLTYNGANYSVSKEGDISLSDAIAIIDSKHERIIKTLSPKCRILNGKTGPFIALNGKFYSIPSEKNPLKLTLKECIEISKLKK